MPERWTPAAIPQQTGKLAYITGANSGVGFYAALELAHAGCAVVLACRNRKSAEMARAAIVGEAPGAEVEIADLDLANLDSVRAAAQAFLATGRRLDLLINNAGVMAFPARKTTAQGFEAQFGTNHLGHFALTGLLLPVLLRPRSDKGNQPARIITVSSIAHRGGTMDFSDLQWERGYRPWPAYRRSKLANLLFGFELERRLERAQVQAMSIVVHPGVSQTNLFKAGPGSGGGVLAKVIPHFIELTAQSAMQGSWPTLYAATSDAVRGGRYYGPDGFREMRGYPVEVRAEQQAYDEVLAVQLWQVSEELIGVRYPL